MTSTDPAERRAAALQVDPAPSDEPRDEDLLNGAGAEPAPSAPSAGPRKGPELVRATRPFAEERPARSWAELMISLAAISVTWAVAFSPLHPALRLVGSVLTALLIVRLFIIYHDAMHGAIFRGSRAAQPFLWGIGLLSLSPPAVWRETHDYHHKNNCKLPGTAIGSYPIVTTRMWRRMSPSERRTYTIARHPLFIAAGYFTIFAAGMCLGSFARNPRVHWAGPVALLLHAVVIALVSVVLGAAALVFGLAIPLLLAFALGSYLFYAQHNYPDVVIADRQRWNYHDAALASSSMFEMSPVMHWFTGNIGYHHIHHLNHRIPFYNLPAAMRALPELQNPGRTSWHPRDIAACFSLKLWDPSKGRMVGFHEARV